jgi:hypothetical protein
MEMISEIERQELNAYEIPSRIHWNIEYVSWDRFPFFQKFLAGKNKAKLEKACIKKPCSTVLSSQSPVSLPIVEEAEYNICTQRGSDVPSKLPLSSQWLVTCNVYASVVLKI